MKQNALAVPATPPSSNRNTQTPGPRRPKRRDGELSKSMLFVTNLGYRIDDAGLIALFADASIPVTSARIVRRRRGNPRESKGYGFVDVGGEEGQKKAIEALQGQEVDQRRIVVKVASIRS
jgi:RNA recognition motif-containing protein